MQESGTLEFNSPKGKARGGGPRWSGPGCVPRLHTPQSLPCLLAVPNSPAGIPHSAAEPETSLPVVPRGWHAFSLIESGLLPGLRNTQAEPEIPTDRAGGAGRSGLCLEDSN